MIIKILIYLKRILMYCTDVIKLTYFSLVTESPTQKWMVTKAKASAKKLLIFEKIIMADNMNVCSHIWCLTYLNTFLRVVCFQLLNFQVLLLQYNSGRNSLIFRLISTTK